MFRRFMQRSGLITNQAINTDFLTDLRFHDLRHEATSRLFELGLSTEAVIKITGHKTISMLARYTHLRAESIVEKMKALKRAANQTA